MGFLNKKLYAVTEEMKRRAIEEASEKWSEEFKEAIEMDNRKIELKANDDNFVTVGELVSTLKKLPQDMEIIIMDNEYRGRALNEDDLYKSSSGKLLYIGGDLEEE